MRGFFFLPFVLAVVFVPLLGCGLVFAQEPVVQITNYADSAAVKKFSDEMEERIKKYMFIVESMGFKLSELIFDSEKNGFTTLIFQGKISISDEKFKELEKKYTDETKLMTILRIIHERDKDSGYSLSPQQIVLTTTIPPKIRVHFK